MTTTDCVEEYSEETLTEYDLVLVEAKDVHLPVHMSIAEKKEMNIVTNRDSFQFELEGRTLSGLVEGQVRYFIYH